MLHIFLFNRFVRRELEDAEQLLVTQIKQPEPFEKTVAELKVEAAFGRTKIPVSKIATDGE